MSSRALRKLKGNDLERDLARIAPPQKKDDSDDDDADDEVSHAAPPSAAPRRDYAGGARPRNPFELLNVANNSCSESEVKEDDDLDGESDKRTGAAGAPGITDNKYRNRKKRRSRKKPPGNRKSSEDTLEDAEDEVDRSVREVNRILGKAPAAVATAHKQRQAGGSNLLSVDYKKLNPENEMKKIFGSRVVHEAAAARQHHHHHYHHRRGVGGGRTRASTVKRWIIEPKPNWPNPGKTGLSMRFVESDDSGNQYFAFEHSPAYQAVQRQFFEAVDSMNPDFIVQLLNQHPFHIDAMLQLSDIAKMGEDVQTAMELVERTLYAQESAFHPLFNLAVGTSRLEYKRQENRSFFIALFRHLNFVGSRACYQTALEFCKLILGLDPDSDPVGVLLMADFYALRAQQYEWMVAFYEEWEPTRNLSLLPNWAFGVAAAQFYLADAAGSSKDFSVADSMLQEALSAFPGALLPLLDKCSVDADDAVARHKFFVEAQRGQPEGLELLTRLFIGRSYHTWKVPELLPWLERNAKAVIALVDEDPSIATGGAERRRARYRGIPRNVLRHVVMSDIKDATVSLPREVAENPVMSFDPLPPADSIELYEKSSRHARAIDDPSALRLFFRSMLPNFDPNRPEPQQEEGVEQQDGARGVDLRRSVNSLYEAMQDLLSNLQLPEVPHEAGAADSEDSDDENEWQ